MKRNSTWKEQRRLIKRLIREMSIQTKLAVEEITIGGMNTSSAQVLIQENKYNLEVPDITWAQDVFIRWFRLYRIAPKKVLLCPYPVRRERLIEFIY